MATKKISELDPLVAATPESDYVAITNAGATKKMLLQYILAGGVEQITSLTALTAPAPATDYLALSDASAGTIKKILINDLYRCAAGIASNVAVGTSSLGVNASGVENVAVGWTALAANTTGSFSVAVGRAALMANTTGAQNTAVGKSAMLSNEGGSYNSAVGFEALKLNVSGLYNSAFGKSAGSAITTGSNLTCLGYNAQASAVNATNEITLGDTNVATLRCKVTSITGTSDERDKKNIELITHGLDFIMDLLPKKWTWDMRTLEGEDLKIKADVEDIGFVAQDLDAVVQARGDVPGLVFKANPERWESAPGKLLPIAIKAIQELAAMNNALMDRVAALEKAVAEK